MRIGIDAKWFFEGPASGRVVVRNLVEHLIEITSDDDLYIFLDKRSQDLEFPYRRPHVHLVYVWGGVNMLSNIVVVPFCARDLHLDILIFQNFSPVFSNFKRYAYIHDVLFKTHPYFYTYVERIYFWPLKYLAWFAHRLCTVSATEKKRMIEIGYGSEENIDVVYHGVDEAFMPREKHDDVKLQAVIRKYDLPDTFILYVGRLNVRKNVFNLLRAMPLLKNSTVPLVVVGAYDWKMTSVDGLLTELGVKDRIIFTGPIYGAELPRIYALSKVVCFVSYAESFGLPALEGMASGVPVVVSNRTCLPEICSDAALYAEPDSPTEIAGMIDRLLDDSELWQQQRERGLKRASDFTWRKSAEHLLKSAYRTVRKEFSV
jgi:glycosyltransferase involved in cell wall biosynthesis